MTRADLNAEQAQQLYRLCQWEDEEHRHQGEQLARSLLGSRWERFDLDVVAAKNADARSRAEELALAYDFANRLEQEDRDEAQCLKRALSLAPHPLITRQLLTHWTLGGSYNYPSYDLGWQLVNLGLYQAHRQAEAELFHDLLAGVSVVDDEGFEVDPKVSPLPVEASFEILLQHQVRGLIGLAPADCERAVKLRTAVRGLSIDASFDVYKWEREFPVDCTPLATFENLETLQVRNGSPVINCQALEHCEHLTTQNFAACHLPWSQDNSWSLEQLQRAARGEDPSLPPWKGSPYVSLETGKLFMMTRYGDRFDSKAEPPPKLSLGFTADSDEARFLLRLLSEDEAERRQALAWGQEEPQLSQKVLWVEDKGLEAWGRLPWADLPNTRLSTGVMNHELFELLLSREPDRFAPLLNLQLSEVKWLKRLDWLRFTPALRQLTLQRCQQLESLDGIEKAPELRHLVLSGAESLQSLDGLQHCHSLASFAMSLNAKVTDFGALAELSGLKRLDLGFCGLHDLTGLPEGLRLESISLHHCRTLSSVAGMQRLRGPAQGGPLKVDLSDCYELTDLTGLGDGLMNLHVNLANCKGLEDLSGLAQAKDLEKLLLVLAGCDGLQDLSALNDLPKLRKLHVNLTGLSQARALEESLDLNEDVKLVIERRYDRFTYSFT